MISRVLEACLYATDLDAAERFYVDVLGLERYSGMPGRHVFFRCGAGMFLVFNPARTSSEPSRERIRDGCQASFELRIAAAVLPATLPPETTTATVLPSTSGTLPASRAPTPAAAPGSAASFARS